MTQLSHAFATANPALNIGWSSATADDLAAMHAMKTFREFDRDEAEAFHKDAQSPTERFDGNPRTPVLLTSSADVAVAETVRDGVERFIGVASETITGNRNANRRDVALERLGEFLRGADDLTLEAIAVASERSVYDLAGIVRIALDLLEKGKS